MGISQQAGLAATDRDAGWGDHEYPDRVCDLCFYPDDLGRQKSAFQFNEVWRACGRQYPDENRI